MSEVPLYLSRWKGEMDLEEASAKAERWVNPSGKSTFQRPLSAPLINTGVPRT